MENSQKKQPPASVAISFVIVFAPTELNIKRLKIKVRNFFIVPPEMILSFLYTFAKGQKLHFISQGR